MTVINRWFYFSW